MIALLGCTERQGALIARDFRSCIDETRLHVFYARMHKIVVLLISGYAA